MPTYDFILGTVEEEPVAALLNCEWQASKWYKEKQRETVHLEIFADSYLFDGETADKRQDRVLSFSQKSREFGFRYEKRKVIEVRDQMNISNDSDVSEYLTEHDAFALI